MTDFDPVGLFSDGTKLLIKDVSSFSPSNIDDMLRVREADDRSHKLHILLSSWSEQQSQERKLRKIYAICFVILLCLQIVMMAVAFYLIGIGKFNITETQFNVFFVSIFGEIVSLVLIITKYLFPKDGDRKLLEMLKDL